jgi:hypothetical protein
MALGILELGPDWTAAADADCFCFDPAAGSLRVWVEVDMGLSSCV